MAFIGGSLYWLHQNLPRLIEKEIGNILVAQGVSDFELGEFYWGLEGAGSSSIVINGQRENWLFSIRLSRVQAVYHWRALLEGELRSLSVGKVRFTLNSLGAGTSESTPLTKTAIIEGLQNLVLPVNDLRVNGLDGIVAVGGDTLTILGRDLLFNNQQQSLSGELNISLTGNAVSTMVSPISARLELSPSPELSWLPKVKLWLSEASGSVVEADIVVDENLNIESTGTLASSTVTSLLAGYAPNLDGIASGVRTLNHFDVKLDWPQKLDLSHPDWWREVALVGTLEAETNVDEVPDIGLREVSLLGALAFEKGDNGWVFRITGPIEINANVTKERWPQLEHLALEDDSAPVNVSIFSSEDISLNLDDINLDDRQSRPQFQGVNASNISFAVDIKNQVNLKGRIPDLVYGNALVASFEADLNGKYQEVSLPAANVRGNLKHDFQDSGTGESKYPVLEIHSTIDIKALQLVADVFAVESHDSISVSGKVKIDNLVPLLQKTSEFGVDTSAIELASGFGELEFKTSKKTTAIDWHTEVSVRGENVSGLIAGVAVSNLSAVGGFVRDSYWHSADPFSLSIPKLSLGVTVENFSMDGELMEWETLERSEWNLASLSGEVFSGRFELKQPARIQFPIAGNTIDVELSNLELSDVFELYTEQGISGTGTISGFIPVHLDAKGVTIDNGRLYNIDVGNIRFSASGKNQWGNEQLAMTMRLLEDFRYDLLKVSAAFDPSGDLLLVANISGNNPAEFDGRKVNFNINLEENLFDLYKALSLTDKLTRELEEKIQGKTGK